MRCDGPEHEMVVEVFHIMQIEEWGVNLGAVIADPPFRPWQWLPLLSRARPLDPEHRRPFLAVVDAAAPAPLAVPP